MRLIPSFFAALIALTALAGCGTKTPLSQLPQPAAKTAVPPVPTSATVDNSNKAITEPRQ